MKKILRVEVSTQLIESNTFSYMYEDNKGVVVRMEGFPNEDDLEKDIKKKIKHLSNESYKLVKVKI